MVRTKIITDIHVGYLQTNINNFIEDKNVIDIKFTSVVAHGRINDRALIIYEEKEDEECEESNIDPNAECSTCEYAHSPSSEYPCNLCIVNGKITNNMYTPK